MTGNKTSERCKLSLDIMLAIEHLAQAHHRVLKMDDVDYVEKRLEQTSEKLEEAKKRVKSYRKDYEKE